VPPGRVAGARRELLFTGGSVDGKVPRVAAGSVAWQATGGGYDGDPCELSGHSDGAPCVAISRDGKHIVSGSDDQLVKIWNAATGAEVRILEILLRGCNLGSRSGFGDFLDL